MPVTTAAFSAQGTRPLQEDRYFTLRTSHRTLGTFTILAVIDGHCGRTTADTLLHHLPSILLSSLAAHYATSPPTALRVAVADADECALRAARRTRTYDGATLALAVIEHSSGAAHVAHVGDCRAMVVFEDATFKRLTVDHCVSGNENEAKRVRNTGANVVAGRLVSISTDKRLDVSRAVGDRDFKDLDTSLARPRALSSTPDLAYFNVNHTTLTLVLASDGLSDVQGFGDDAIAARAAGSLQHAARDIVQAALRCRNSDNSTVVLARFTQNEEEDGEENGCEKESTGVQRPVLPKNFPCVKWQCSTVPDDESGDNSRALVQRHAHGSSPWRLARRKMSSLAALSIWPS